MFNKFVILALTVFALQQVVFAQPADYQKLYRSSGELPKEFKTTSYSQYLLEREGIDATLAKKERKEQQQFYIESNYWVFDLQYSGKVIFGNELFSYLNQIKSNLLDKTPDLNAKITIYPIRYASLNAFATHAGNIYVNIGLLARVRTEDEIAYILAHEIATIPKSTI